jgi:hypothetical protein
VDYAVRIPIDENALFALEKLLTTSDVFTTTFQDLGNAVFRAETYMRESIEHDTETVVLMDRNLFTRLISLGNGERSTGAHRVAAGVLAFAQTTESVIEPNMALYELAATSDAQTASSELQAFKRLDNSHPQLFVDVAIGRKDSLELAYLSSDTNQVNYKVDFTMPLRRWRANYTVALKIAVLEISPGPAERKMRALISWMQDEFLHIGPALCLANRYLAPNGPRKRLFKSLRSSDRNRALAGVRNAAWDLAFVSEWLSKVETQGHSKTVWVLATLDRGLHDIARACVRPASPTKPKNFFLRKEFVNFWGADRGERLANLYVECLRHRESGAAPISLISPGAAEEKIRILEAQILEEWVRRN